MIGTYINTTHLIYIPKSMFKPTFFDQTGIKNIYSAAENPSLLHFSEKKIKTNLTKTDNKTIIAYDVKINAKQ